MERLKQLKGGVQQQKELVEGKGGVEELQGRAGNEGRGGGVGGGGGYGRGEIPATTSTMEEASYAGGSATKMMVRPLPSKAARVGRGVGRERRGQLLRAPGVGELSVG